MTIFMIVLLTFGAAFFLNLTMTPLILFVSHKFKWYDRLDHRKIHKGDIPRIGGIGIFLSYLVASTVSLFLTMYIFRNDGMTWNVLRYVPIICGISIIHVAGLVDDFTNMRPLYKFLIQIAAGLVVALGGITVKEIIVPFSEIRIPLGIFAVPATVFWMVALSNAINFIDGMDGLAGGISAIAALFLGISSIISGQYLGGVLSFALFGALIGFLFFNFPPARLFMGDSGALFLGFTLAVIPLVHPGETLTTYSILPAITVLLIPILDTAAAIIRRIRNHKPISAADREHLHHKLLDLKMKPRSILMMVYSACLLLGIVAVTWSMGQFDSWRMIVMLVSWVACVGLFITLDRLNRARKASVRAASMKKEIPIPANR